MENNVYKDGYHVLRDISKCGLTYNTKDIFPIVRRLLDEFLPDSRWDRFKIYEKMTYIDDEGSHEANKGYFLGMANHTVTLCNIVISRMARNMTYARIPSKFVKNSTLVGNDDLNARFSPKCKEALEIAQDYLNNEHEIHAMLGNKTNRKKSVVKEFGLFYENYGVDGWKGKESLVCNAIACAYLAPDIRTAKIYISGQSDRFKSRWAFAELVKLAKYWGPEFFTVETELRISNQIGGWLNTTSYGLITALLDLDEIWEKWEHMIPLAYATCKRTFSSPKPEHKTQESVSNHIYKGPSKKSDPRVQLFTLGYNDTMSFYKRLTTYQRKFRSRLDGIVVRVIKYRELLEIQQDILKTPWHCIPDSLVAYQTWSSSHLRALSSESELYRWDTDPIASLLEGNIEPMDEIMTWDPLIPSYARGIKINTTLWNYRACSQFSNSGAIPILEYFYRHRIYPMPKFLPKTRVRESPENDMRIVDKQTPGLRRHFEKCFYKHEHLQNDRVQEEELTEESSQIQEKLNQALESVSSMLLGNDSRPAGSIIQAADLLTHSKDELLDKLLAQDDTEYDHKNRPEDGQFNDFFDDSDDEAFDFGIF